jgi:hypothetical protein
MEKLQTNSVLDDILMIIEHTAYGLFRPVHALKFPVTRQV